MSEFKECKAMDGKPKYAKVLRVDDKIRSALEAKARLSKNANKILDLILANLDLPKRFFFVYSEDFAKLAGLNSEEAKKALKEAVLEIYKDCFESKEDGEVIPIRWFSFVRLSEEGAEINVSEYLIKCFIETKEDKEPKIELPPL